MITIEEAQAIIDGLPDDVADYISNRGGNHGIDQIDLIRKTPSELHDNPAAMEAFMRSRDISHYHATSKGGCPNCFDNWMFEDPSINRSRGNDYMTPEERQSAYQGNSTHAAGVNGDFTKVKNGALGGLGLAFGMASAPTLAAIAFSPLGVVAAGAAACVYAYKKRDKINDWLENNAPEDVPPAKPATSEE